MEINTTSSAVQAQGISASVGVTMLKKALDIEAQSAMALIAAIPQPAQNASNLPANLGQNINTTA
jgi:hypothetical protein